MIFPAWVFLAVAILVFWIMLFVSSLVARNRSKHAPMRANLATLQEEVTLLRAEVASLRKEVEQVKQGRGTVRSTHIQEG